MAGPAPFPAFTKLWHTDTYSAIDPKRPELSLFGKKVVITGGAAGIGRGISQAFVDAGAASIAILGRRADKLQETKVALEASSETVKVTTHVVDVVDHAAVKEAADEIGAWDILVSNAGYMPEMVSVVDSDVNEWWKGFEINVKGSFNVCHSFLPKRKPHAAIISISAGSLHIPTPYQRNGSGYNASKFAALKFFEILAVENPDLHVVSMHPGVVDTDMFRKGSMRPPSMDTVELGSHFAVWLCSEEAKFLRGRMVWCNWDVEEMKAKADRIISGSLLTSTVEGWSVP